MNRQAGIVGWVAVATLGLGCGKGGTGGPAVDARDTLIETFKQGKVALSPVTPVTVSFGRDCKTGSADSIDILVCVYPTAAEATAAEKPALAWVGDATGA